MNTPAKKLTLIFPVFFLSVLGQHAYGSEEIILDNIIVTATPVKTEINEAARSVSVVTKERIQSGTQKLALDEVLSGIPGLYMQNRYNFAQDLRLSLRGFGARSSFGIRGVRIIVDGIPETMPDGQAQVDSIDLGSASRIEVLRGPASAIYGNAAGGVIFIESELGTRKPYLESSIAAGDFNYERYQVKAGGSTEYADYMLNATQHNFDGYRAHSKTRGSQFNSKFRFYPTGNDEFFISASYTDQPEAQDPGGLTAAQSILDPASAQDRNVLFDAGEELNQKRISLSYRTNRIGGDLVLHNYYVWRDFSNKLPFTNGGAVDLQRFFTGFGIKYSRNDLFSGRLKLTGGLDIERQDDDRFRFDNNNGVLGALVFEQEEKVSDSGFYLHGQYSWDAAWIMLLGLRYDEVVFNVSDRFLVDGDDSGKLDFDQVSTSLALNYTFGKNVLFGSYSTSFETPTTTELAKPDGSGGFNEALEPQTSDSYEIGYKYITPELRYELSVFQIDLNNELVPFEVITQPGRTFYSNTGSSTRRGLETAFSWNGESGISVDLAYTWSDFTFDQFIDENSIDYSGKKLPGLPEHFAYLSLSYRDTPGFTATFETIYSGNLYADNSNNVIVDDYVVSNLRASYEIMHKNWQIKPYLGFNNIFGEKYNSNIRINATNGRYFEPAPTGNYYFGITVNFQDSRWG